MTRTKPRQERDGPTKEQAQKFWYEPVYAEKGGKGESHKVQGQRRVYNLEKAYKRKELSPQQYLAACEIVRLREKGWKDAGQTASYGQGTGGGEGWSHLPATEQQADYRRRYNQAKDAVNPDYWLWVYRLLFEGGTVEGWAAMTGGSVRTASGIIMNDFKRGLNQLASKFVIR